MAIPKGTIRSESDQGKTPKRNSKANAAKNNFLSDIFGTKDSKRKRREDGSPTEIPSEMSQAKVPRRTIRSERSHAKDASQSSWKMWLESRGAQFRLHRPLHRDADGRQIERGGANLRARAPNLHASAGVWGNWHAPNAKIQFKYHRVGWTYDDTRTIEMIFLAHSKLFCKGSWARS